MDWKPPELEMNDVTDVRSLSREDLKKIGGNKWKMYCGVDGCYHYTTVYDFGIGSYWCPNVSGGIWMDIMKEFFICGPHNKKYRFQKGKIPEKKGPWINNVASTINHPDFPEK